MAENTVKMRQFSDGVPISMDKNAIVKESFRMPEFKCIGGMIASGNIKMEIASGHEHDPIGKALRIVAEQSGVVSRQRMEDAVAPRHMRARGSEKPEIKKGDTVKAPDTGKKYVVIKASVDTSDSGFKRHLVMSLKSSNYYKIADNLLVKL